MQIPLSNPDLTFHEKQLVLQVLESPKLSLGPYLAQFENDIADYLGCKYAVAVNSGTSGLHLAIKATNLSAGDEVITTPFSFIASANCILYEKCIPIFVDIEPETLNMNVNQIEEKITNKTSAILPVHVFGLPCEMKKILAIAEKYKLVVIEDACEAIGAEYSIGQDITKKVGTLGNCGVFAFYPNKQLTTGEGGVIVTNNQTISEICRSLRNQGRSNNGKWLQHERLGYNYRISELNCALGVAQLSRINEILAKRTKIAEYYTERLNQVKTLVLPPISRSGKESWFVYVVRLTSDFNFEDRNKIMKKLIAKGIECNCYFPPIHLQPFYMKIFGFQKGDFPVTEYVSERTIALPFFSNMTENQVDYVCTELRRILKEF